MDPALLAIATSSANALVSLMTTDIWERTKGGLSTLFSRLSKSPEMIVRELEESRRELVASTERQDQEETTAEIQQMWRGKFRRLLAEHPDAAKDLQELIKIWQVNSGDAETGPGNMIHQTATAHDNSRIYQQGSGVQHNG
ncbi:hypothetical protein ACWDR2_10020 [Streptomyces sp. NPDC003631]